MSVNLNVENTACTEQTVPLSIPEQIATELVGAKIDRYRKMTPNGWKTFHTSERDVRTMERIMQGFEPLNPREVIGKTQRTYLVHVTLSELRLIKKFVVSSLQGERCKLERLEGGARIDGVRRSIQQLHQFVQLLNHMLGERGDGRCLCEWREHVVNNILKLQEELISIVDEAAILMYAPRTDDKTAGGMAYELNGILKKFSTGLRGLQLL